MMPTTGSLPRENKSTSTAGGTSVTSMPIMRRFTTMTMTSLSLIIITSMTLSMDLRGNICLPVIAAGMSCWWIWRGMSSTLTSIELKKTGQSTTTVCSGTRFTTKRPMHPVIVRTREITIQLTGSAIREAGRGLSTAIPAGWRCIIN